MRKPNSAAVAVAIVYLATCVHSLSAQKLDATVLYRQDSDTNYFAIIPGYSSNTSEGHSLCSLDSNPADCSGTANTNGSLPAGNEVSYNLVGTTLSILLPDGRVALLNCVNKYSSKGNYINRRSCGMPLVEHVQAEFNGKTAKLRWPVGSDRKTESETYKVVAWLDKQLVATR